MDVFRAKDRDNYKVDLDTDNVSLNLLGQEFVSFHE